MADPDGTSTLDDGSTERVARTPRHAYAVARAAVAEPTVDDSLVCSICFTGEANAAIIPCGHSISCVRCLERCEACPVCRKPIEKLLRIYRS